MPHIKPNPPRPPPSPFPPIRPDPDERDDRALTAAVRELTEWLKANHVVATKRDLELVKADIIRAIRAGGGITASVEAAANKLQQALDSLDAQVPDK